MEAPRSSVRSLEVFLLGRFAVRVAGKDVDLEATPGRKARMLLKLLALQRNHQIIRDQAIDLLWPDLDLESGASQLYKAIYHLRQVFSGYQTASDTDGWIDLTGELVRLAPGGQIETDVKRFKERARQGLTSDKLQDLEGAAALYSGDLLPMDLYVEWTSVPRDHMKQLYLDVLLALAERHRLQGNLVGASEYFRQALQKDPLLEKAHRGLMQVYALQGQTDRSLRPFGERYEAYKARTSVLVPIPNWETERGRESPQTETSP